MPFFDVILILSLFSFCLYGLDKIKAKRKSKRIAEISLHTIDLIGGWPGGLLAQHLFHHKVKKTEFQAVFWLTVMVNTAGIGLYFASVSNLLG